MFATTSLTTLSRITGEALIWLCLFALLKGTTKYLYLLAVLFIVSLELNKRFFRSDASITRPDFRRGYHCASEYQPGNTARYDAMRLRALTLNQSDHYVYIAVPLNFFDERIGLPCHFASPIRPDLYAAAAYIGLVRSLGKAVSWKHRLSTGY